MAGGQTIRGDIRYNRQQGNHFVRLKVAVLEDDAEYREEILVPQLAEIGFDAEGFASSAQLYRRMLAVPFHLLVLDLRLSDENGLDVARYLRENSAIGIVTLTGQGTHAEQVKGLTEAIDAWLVKPIDIDLLGATLHSLARRMQLVPKRDDVFPPSSCWRLPQDGWRLYSPANRSILLNLPERCLLTRLFATAGELVPHEELIRALASVTDNFDRHRLEILIHRLRRKVAVELGVSLPLRSVRGAGYVMLTLDERSREI